MPRSNFEGSLSWHSISYFSGEVLTLNDLRCVLEEVLDVSAQWYILGLQLKVRIGTLDCIQVQFPDPKHKLLEVLKTWLTTGDNTNWKTLIDTLRSRSIGACQLAGVLEIKYCQMEGTKVHVGNGMSAYESQLKINFACKITSKVEAKKL